MFPDDLAGVADGTLIGSHISQEEYLERFAAFFCEWANGTVTRIAASYMPHLEMVTYLSTLLDVYFAKRRIGRIVRAPFVMKLNQLNTIREPDIQVILKVNAHHLTEDSMNGPANICIEVVSPNSTARDRGEKFAEYERAGVPEYWVIDPDRKDARFYHLNSDGLYKPQPLHKEQWHQTPQLPNFRLPVAVLFQGELPDIHETIEQVEAMLSHEG